MAESLKEVGIGFTHLEYTNIYCNLTGYITVKAEELSYTSMFYTTSLENAKTLYRKRLRKSVKSLAGNYRYIHVSAKISGREKTIFLVHCSCCEMFLLEEYLYSASRSSISSRLIKIEA